AIKKLSNLYSEIESLGTNSDPLSSPSGGLGVSSSILSSGYTGSPHETRGSVHIARGSDSWTSNVDQRPYLISTERKRKLCGQGKGLTVLIGLSRRFHKYGTCDFPLDRYEINRHKSRKN